ncbi:NAD(P)H-dependent oxidoreductase [Litorilituus lipolyticus]|uniref:NADPH-dependent oxidoreductase n=1 Tax=Litorilituus lipolyticus TaxID=2491017 RepID=A0A502KMH5_9GAMM|nr:NAD(P)H-dependent oxidoreductase [Litorilituus lipolyticus]TPH12880.1 NADPH-dependent oxidoreductase [Litorilituus lipolyticus]
MKVLLISASQRPNSNSAAISQLIQKIPVLNTDDVETDILDLSLWPELLEHYGILNNENSALLSKKQQVLEKLYQCDAVVFIVPEWGGMIPPALVNLLLLTANGSAGGLPLGHKPAFAIGISASGGGSNPISLLKAYAAKNSHLVWLPLHAIVQNVDDFLTQSWQPEAEGRYTNVQSRIDVGITSLLVYAKQLKEVREQLVQLSVKHPFGQ